MTPAPRMQQPSRRAVLRGLAAGAAVTAIDGGVVSPSADAAEARSAWVTVSAWLITAVLHEWANAVVHGIVPSALLGYPSSLLNV